MNDFTNRELLKHDLRLQELKESTTKRHSDRLRELEEKHGLDLERQREKLAYDREIHQQKHTDKQEDIELNHRLALSRQEDKQAHDKRQKELDHQSKYKELYLKSKVDYLAHGEQLDHNLEISGKEHKHRLTEKEKDQQHEITVLNGKYQGDLALARQDMSRELTLQREQSKSNFEQMELVGKMEYNKALDTEYEITGRVIAVEKEQTKRALKLAKKQHNHELTLVYTQHLALLDEKKLDALNHINRIEKETKAYQEKEDADLDRRFLEGKEQLNNELVRFQAELVKMTHANDLQKDLEAHRFMLMQQAGTMGKDEILAFMADFTHDVPEYR